MQPGARGTNKARVFVENSSGLERDAVSNPVNLLLVSTISAVTRAVVGIADASPNLGAAPPLRSTGTRHFAAFEASSESSSRAAATSASL